MYEKIFDKCKDIRITAFLLSILLSLWAIHDDNIINNDGILYLRTAELFSAGDWRAAIDLYRWPFYSWIISLGSQLFSLELETSAHLINVLLFGVIVVSFITLISLLGGDRNTQIAGALLILIFPGINDYRPDIIRDTGFLAFYLLGLVFVFAQLKHKTWKYSIGWLSAFALATLFRIEGLLFLAFSPMLLWLAHRSETLSRLRIIIVMLSVLLLGGIAAYALWHIGLSMMHTTDASSSEPLYTVLQNRWQGMLSLINHKLDGLRTAFLPTYSKDYAGAIFVASALIILIHSILSKLNLFFAILVIYAWHKKIIFPLNKARYVWLWFIGIGIAILAFIVFIRLFITGRWPMPVNVTLILAAPFGLNLLYKNWRNLPHKNWKNHSLFGLVLLLFLTTAISGLTSSGDKNYIKQAGVWLKENSSDSSHILSNSAKLIYYSGKNDYTKRYKTDRIKKSLVENKGHFDYLALYVKRKSSNETLSIKDLLKTEPIQVFSNAKGDRIEIYAID